MPKKRFVFLVGVGVLLLLVGVAEAGKPPYRKLTASDPHEQDDFGWSVAIDGNVAIVGARRGDSGWYDDGTAYLYDVTTGAQLFKLAATDGFVEDWFGSSVSVSGNYAVVGASRDDDIHEDAGSAFVFDVTTGVELHQLLASDAGRGDAFGGSVGISGNVIVAGANDNYSSPGVQTGAAYLYDAATGTELFKLLASDAAHFDRFGTSVAISGNLAVVGANGNDDAGLSSGSAYIFDVTTGAELRKLTASDAAEIDNFGQSVAIGGNRVIVGAPFDDDNGEDSGSAYVFDAQTGQQLHKLKASEGVADDQFGGSVSISGNYAVVGAYQHDNPLQETGAAYVFDLTTGEELFMATPSDPDSHDYFGWTVAISGDNVLVGAASGGDLDVGAAYLYNVPEPATIFLLGCGAAALLRRRSS